MSTEIGMKMARNAANRDFQLGRANPAPGVGFLDREYKLCADVVLCAPAALTERVSLWSSFELQ